MSPKSTVESTVMAKYRPSDLVRGSVKAPGSASDMAKYTEENTMMSSRKATPTASTARSRG
jgi:hypothetical protein